MGATFDVSVIAQLTGLGKQIEFAEKGTDETPPTAATYNYRVMVASDTAEALDLGDVSTPTCAILYAVDYDVLIDCDYSDSFDVDMTAKAAGIPAVIPYPAGDIYVQGESGETPKFEYILVGTT